LASVASLVSSFSSENKLFIFETCIISFLMLKKIKGKKSNRLQSCKGKFTEKKNVFASLEDI
jgi:hypothetical protein